MSSLPEMLHRQMVDRLVAEGYVQTPAVEAALRAVPRHGFMPWADPEMAYDWQRTASCDEGHPSAPNVVAHWLELAALAPGQNVLEIGASTGYSAALTSLLVGEAGRVTTVEISPLRLDRARRRLAALGYTNVEPVLGDGFDGARDHARGALTGGIASPIYLFWVGMDGRFPFWPEERMEPLVGLLRRALARHGLPRQLPAPDLREPVLTEINLAILVLLEFEARGIAIATFNGLPEAEASAAVETILERWEQRGRPGFWRLLARVQLRDSLPPNASDYAIPRGDTTLFFHEG
jgi:SAM-dependent methyltransferase